MDVINTLSTFEKQELSKSERPELTAAKTVISGGIYIIIYMYIVKIVVLQFVEVPFLHTLAVLLFLPHAV